MLGNDLGFVRISSTRLNPRGRNLPGLGNNSSIAAILLKKRHGSKRTLLGLHEGIGKRPAV